MPHNPMLFNGESLGSMSHSKAELWPAPNFFSYLSDRHHRHVATPHDAGASPIGGWTTLLHKSHLAPSVSAILTSRQDFCGLVITAHAESVSQQFEPPLSALGCTIDSRNLVAATVVDCR